MKLNLKRPIAFFDLETTGLNQVHDRIIEVSVLRINVNGTEEQRTWRINPECVIPSETTAVHGITNDDVAREKTFRQLAPEISRFFGNCDLAGYNILKFDLPMLVEEFIRAGVNFDLKDRQLIDVQNIFMKMEPRTLRGAYRFFMNKDFDNAHSANADTMATYEVLMAMLDRYKDTEYTDNKGVTTKPIINDMSELARFSSHHQNVDLMGQIVYDDEGKPVFKFGKHKDERVEDVFRKEPQYYDWIMKSDFPEYTKRIVTKLRYPDRNISF